MLSEEAGVMWQLPFSSLIWQTSQFPSRFRVIYNINITEIGSQRWDMNQPDYRRARNGSGQREGRELLDWAELPEQLRNIVVDNKKMTKQIVILQAEIAEKARVIEQLKEQLDNTVVEQTQDRLSLARTIQQQVEGAVKEVKQRFMERSMQMQGEIEGLREVVRQLRQQLSLEQEKTGSLRTKLQSLRQYILQVVMQEDKDELIARLSAIVQEQQQRITQCTHCVRRCQPSSQAAEEPAKKKKGPAIRKNE